MTQPEPEVRVGFAERDRATTALQEHLAAGRLETDEFDERVGAALKAKTRGELDALFTDLPGDWSHAQVAVRESAPVAETTPAPAPLERPMPAILGSWIWLVPAIALAAATRGRLGLLVPITVLWVFVAFPMLNKPRPVAPTTALRAEDLSLEQRREVTELVNSGEKIKAIKRYRELTGAGLADAKTAIDTWQGQLER